MKTPEQATRILKLYNFLRRGPATFEVIQTWALRSSLETSQRSLYRDLKFLEKPDNHLFDGEKVVVTKGEKNRKTWKVVYNRSGRDLSEFDITSFHLFKHFAPLALVHARSTSLNKIATLLYAQQSKSRFEHFAQAAEMQIAATHFYEFPYTENYQQILQDCIWSIQHQLWIQLDEVAYDYTSMAASIRFPLRFAPLQILYHRGCIHVGGLTSDKHCLVLALEQLQQGTHATHDIFDASKLMPQYTPEMNKRFGISENMDGQVYDIEIEFSEYTGSFISHHHWHHSQRFSRTPEGNYLLHLRCGINRELVGWIFQWMSNARVRSPQRLVQLVQDKYAEGLAMYEHDKPLFSNNSFKPK